MKSLIVIKSAALMLVSLIPLVLVFLLVDVPLLKHFYEFVNSLSIFSTFEGTVCHDILVEHTKAVGASDQEVFSWCKAVVLDDSFVLVAKELETLSTPRYHAPSSIVGDKKRLALGISHHLLGKLYSITDVVIVMLNYTVFTHHMALSSDTSALKTELILILAGKGREYWLLTLIQYSGILIYFA